MPLRSFLGHLENDPVDSAHDAVVPVEDLLVETVTHNTECRHPPSTWSGIDTIARTLATIEVPPGILTAVIGTPVFIALLARSRRMA